MNLLKGNIAQCFCSDVQGRSKVVAGGGRWWPVVAGGGWGQNGAHFHTAASLLIGVQCLSLLSTYISDLMFGLD